MKPERQAARTRKAPRKQPRQQPPNDTPQIILLNKPFRVLSQFSPHEDKDTLASYIKHKGFYPAGRLDYDSEGLLVLTNHGPLQHRLADPRHKLPKTYWVQVEGEISAAALKQLSAGVTLKDGPTLPATAQPLAEPSNLWLRDPPVRFRAHIPTSWLSLTIHEGRNRQVRRMTAAVGFPTLRLIRWSVGPWNVADLTPGETRLLPAPANLFKSARQPSSRQRSRRR